MRIHSVVAQGPSAADVTSSAAAVGLECLSLPQASLAEVLASAFTRQANAVALSAWTPEDWAHVRQVGLQPVCPPFGALEALGPVDGPRVQYDGLEVLVAGDAFGQYAVWPVMRVSLKVGEARLAEAPASPHDEALRTWLLRQVASARLEGLATVRLHGERVVGVVPNVSWRRACAEWTVGEDAWAWALHLAEGGMLPRVGLLEARGHGLALAAAGLQGGALGRGPFGRLDESGVVSVWAPERASALPRLLAQARSGAAAPTLLQALESVELLRGDLVEREA